MMILLPVLAPRVDAEEVLQPLGEMALAIRVLYLGHSGRARHDHEVQAMLEGLSSGEMDGRRLGGGGEQER